MKKLLLVILLILAFVACDKPIQDSKLTRLNNIFQHLYSLEIENIQSLTLEVSGNHEIVKKFLSDLKIDSGKILVYWKAPFELKTHVFSKTGEPVPLPRWLDFGFAFGIFYGTEMQPVFVRAETEMKMLAQEFRLTESGMLAEAPGENHQVEFLLQDPTQAQKRLKIVTGKDYFPLNSIGTRFFEQNGQKLEIGYSQNWLKLPNNKAVTSIKQQSVNDKSRKKLEYRISYKKTGDYWFPSEIIERKRSAEKGKIQRQDTRLVYENIQINPQLPAQLFIFEEPAMIHQNFSTPDSTLQSLLTAAQAGNIMQMKRCFSREMMSQFEALTNQTRQGITPYDIIPPEMMKKLQDDVTQWVFRSYVEQISKMKTAAVEQTENRVLFNFDYEGPSALLRGKYNLVKEGNDWKIDSNPHVIFQISE